MSILVTGGLGFIGSHIVAELLNTNCNVIVIDNCSNSSLEVKNTIMNNFGIFTFYNNDLLKDDLKYIFENHSIYAVIHCAGLKSVNESIENPIKYYKENINMTLNVLNLMTIHCIKNIIFSSSATIYGSQDAPFSENTIIGQGITNPYGKTKYMIELILQDFDINCICLRYFNPIGCHPSGLIGELPNSTPNNLFPYILQTAFKKRKQLTIFGNDYNTADGTAERDYIHVCDVARAHISTLSLFEDKNNMYLCLNVGTGVPVSVQSIIDTFIKTTNIKINYTFGRKRPGDIPVSFCVVSKILSNIWKPKYTIEDACKHSKKFYSKMK